MDIQLKRGMLDVCVLAAIKDEDSYGYQIIKDISQYIEISESTLYPVCDSFGVDAVSDFTTLRSKCVSDGTIGGA